MTTNDVPCPCPLYQASGTCYHRGYRPIFRDQIPTQSQVPLAVQRSQQFVKENLARWECEEKREA